jgi:hypothetical protein
MTLDTALQEKHCPTCFVHYAAPKAMFDKKQTDGGHWFCPNGHQIIYSESKLDKAKAEADALRRERDALRQNEAWYEDRLKTERKEARALKASLKKVHQRVGNGVCPCCNRQFVNLQRHMASKHADFKQEAA